MQDLRGEDEPDRIGREEDEREQEQRGNEQRGAIHVALAESIGERFGEPDADDHEDDAAAVEHAEARGDRIIGPVELAETDPGQNRIQAADERIESDVIQEARERRLVDVVLKIVNIRSALQCQRDEDEHRNEQRQNPRLVAQEIGHILPDRRLLLRLRNDALLGREERNHEEDRPDDGKEHHRLLESDRLIAVAEHQHERQEQHLNDELSNHDGNEAIGGQAVAVGHVAGEYTAQRCVRKIVCRVNDDEQRVRDRRVVHLSLFAQVRRREREQRKHAERHGGPEDPRSEFAPARVRAIRDQSHDRIEQYAAEEPAPENDRGRGTRRDPEHVRIEEREESDERLENEVSGEIPQAVSHLF